MDDFYGMNTGGYSDGDSSGDEEVGELSSAELKARGNTCYKQGTESVLREKDKEGGIYRHFSVCRYVYLHSIPLYCRCWENNNF